MEKNMEKGSCNWCTKEGIISYQPLDQNFKNEKVNMAIGEINKSILRNKLVDMGDGKFACDRCISKYGLRELISLNNFKRAYPRYISDFQEKYPDDKRLKPDDNLFISRLKIEGNFSERQIDKIIEIMTTTCLDCFDSHDSQDDTCRCANSS